MVSDLELADAAVHRVESRWPENIADIRELRDIIRKQAQRIAVLEKQLQKTHE